MPIRYFMLSLPLLFLMGCNIDLGDDWWGEEPTVCGDLIVDKGELCEGNSKNCVDIPELFSTGGVAPCLPNCKGWDTSACDMAVPIMKRDIAAGDAHTCAIAASGDLFCWGANSYGQCGTGELSTVVAPTRLNSTETWAQVSAGGDHTCAITVTGALYCWGDNTYGQIGDGTTVARTVPLRIAAKSRWSSVAAGASSTCAVTDTGSLFCWGNNREGQCLPDSTQEEFHTPFKVYADDWWLVVNRQCALNREHDIYCWGSAKPLQLEGSLFSPKSVRETLGTVCGLDLDQHTACYTGVVAPFDDTEDESTQGCNPDASEPEYRSLDRSDAHTCGLIRGAGLSCFGDPDYGRAGASQVGYYGAKYDSVATGARHTCMKNTDDTVACFGANDRGQLGDGKSLRTTTEPTPVAIEAQWQRLSLGTGLSCALDSLDTVHCWGALHDGEYTVVDHEHYEPYVTIAGGPFYDISLGTSRLLATSDSGAQYMDLSGSPGTIDDEAPQWKPIPHLTRTTRLYDTNDDLTGCLLNGADLTCWFWFLDTPGTWHAVTPNAFTWTWDDVAISIATGYGLNWRGDMYRWTFGINGNPPLDYPAKPYEEDRRWLNITAGSGHVCGVEYDGLIYCWGNNEYGQLGRGDVENDETPRTVQDPDATLPWITVAAGTLHTCGLKSDGRLYCWGNNSNGALGVGDTEPRNIPTPVTGDLRWRLIAAGNGHTCAVTTDEKLYCWGLNDAAQTGGGPLWTVYPKTFTLK
ncbi:MAG TPA: hypothetical protein PLV42_05645 [bacterium]|nr:hypothetical protein [bacterium]